MVYFRRVDTKHFRRSVTDMNMYSSFVESEIKRDKADIRRYGVLGGICVLGFLFIQEILFAILYMLNLYEFYTSDVLFRQSIEMLFTVISICVPFFVCGAIEKKFTSYDIIPAQKPKDIIQACLAVPAGVALCLIASTVTAYLTYFLEFLGLKLTSPDMSVPESGFELVIYFLRLTVVAGIIEEMSFRGVIMQPLRKYGNGFAITMAAIIFGLVHCNLIQAPFAILAGFVIGYFTVAADSLWVGILIHIFNNTISGVLSFIAVKFGNEIYASVADKAYSGIIFIGLICTGVFFLRQGGISLGSRKTYISNGKKLKAYLLNPAMIFAFIAICWYTHYYISL